ncbi:MAG: tyrosine-type recombinase/integrase, partial [Tepidisphaeraceae bacterium]
RTPSETLSLRWTDVDWEQGRIRVLSPKTEHHEGGASRMLPMFPELRPLLLQAWSEAPEGAEHVIAHYRGGNVNLRTRLERIIRKAGMDPWPKPFHNLRATRQTELAERYPIHVVCAWIGNSAAIAQEHYLQVTDQHFEQAAMEPPEKAAQNPAQSAAGLARNEPQPVGAIDENRLDLPSDSVQCDYLHNSQLPPRGVEPLSSG